MHCVNAGSRPFSGQGGRQEGAAWGDGEAQMWPLGCLQTPVLWPDGPNLGRHDVFGFALAKQLAQI